MAFGCGAAPGGGGMGHMGAIEGGLLGGGGGTSATTPEPDGGEDGEAPESGENDKQSAIQQKPAGLMTAGAWNDNDNYEISENYEKDYYREVLKTFLPFCDTDSFSLHL